MVPTLFSGQYVYETTCLRCHRLSDASSHMTAFYELTVPVKGFSTLEESLVRGVAWVWGVVWVRDVMWVFDVFCFLTIFCDVFFVMCFL